MEIMKMNVKIIVICCLLGCIVSNSDAQDYYSGGGGSWRRRPADNPPPKDKQDQSNPEPSGYISINFGFANPEATFGQPFPQNSFANNYNYGVGIGYGGYASPGSVFHLSLAFPVNHSNFGVALMFGSYDNQYNLNSYVNALNNSPANYNPYSNSPILAYSTAPSTQPDYSASSILAGLFYTYPIGRLSIDARLMLGVLLSDLPEQDVAAIDGAGDQLQYDVEPSSSTSFAVDAGIGARFLVAEIARRKICVMINVDYLYSSISYNTQQDLYVVPATGPNANQLEQLSPTPAITGSIPLQLFNVTFGIGYQL